MKTIILSGPNGSGKTTTAYRLIEQVSPDKKGHLEIESPDSPNIIEMVMLLKKGDYKTVLLDASRPAIIENVGMNLQKNGFQGTFIATTQERNVNVTRLIRCHEVQIRYLHREENGLLKDRIMHALGSIAKECKANLHELRNPGQPINYRYTFPDGTKIDIREGGQR